MHSARKIDETPTITALEMAEIIEEFQAGITASKAMTEAAESIDINSNDSAFFAGAWWALQEAQMKMEEALGFRVPSNLSPWIG